MGSGIFSDYAIVACGTMIPELICNGTRGGDLRFFRLGLNTDRISFCKFGTFEAGVNQCDGRTRN